MGTSSDFPLHEEIPWQATLPSFFLNLRNKLLEAIQAPEIFYRRSSKGLTKEATYIIYIMLAFTLFAIIGSSITTYEFFFNDDEKKTKFFKKVCGENSTMRIVKEKNGVRSHAWLEDCKIFFKCFCIFKNGWKILETSSSKDHIDCIHGLRFVTNAWVIFLHTGLAYLHSLIDLQQAKSFLEWRVSQLVLNGLMSVDTFLVIGGFLNAYHFFQKYSRHNGNISWAFFYFKRFLRLTPVYMIVLAFYATLFTQTGTSILWPTYETNPVCKKDWWWHLLYINNFEESFNMSMGWCWYLAADMQFYAISPLFTISLMRWPRFGYVLILACIGGSCVASFILTYQFDLNDGFTRLVFHLDDFRNFIIQVWKYLDFLYSKPYTRIGSYLVGLALGHYLYKKNFNKNVARNSKMTLCCGWIVTACFFWISVFSIHQREEILMETALFNSIKSLLFSCGLAWIIYVCVTGQADFLNRCLSWKVLLPLSRLSYCAYLIHFIILMRFHLLTEDVRDFSLLAPMSTYFYVFVCTYFISFILSILFEMPALNLLDWPSKKNGKNISRFAHSDCTANTQNLSDTYKIS